MQVIVTFRHVEPTAGLRQHAEEKVQRVRKYLRRPIEAHVTLSVEKQRHIAEVQLSANHLNITATEETDDLYSAIDQAMDKIERQVKRHTAKYKEHKGPNNSAMNALTAERERRGTTIHTQRVAVKPMSVDEAIMQLKLQKNDFLLFTNAATDALSVVYRRKDGNFGLIEPERS
ncbi:MAG TPA: ribosome-associated translation inhibitor RaiA [Candidatus Margulisiibacteriota bacterium]|nr:ribosome-associated translation inhibitor RaiA [Candidatus Margulisiibacteriota bacterium]